MTRTFVGIGFGPIQCGLFLLEARASGNFERLVVAEVVPEIVSAIGRNGGCMRVNIAHLHSLSTCQVEGLEVYNPNDATDAAHLVDAIADADEIATALPSIDVFSRGRPSPAELLARGLERKSADPHLPRTIVYAAENHNRAAERLQEAVTRGFSAADRRRLSDRATFLNTVIGKMSGVLTDPILLEQKNLVPFVAGLSQAVLVEEFNRILISQVPFADFQRGISVFQEKPDLQPFEEAKLFGHNAAHALLGYLAHHAGLSFVHEVDAPLLELVKHAFREESGRALCRRHAGTDPLFTSVGWAEYVNDLVQRMVNPYLLDRVDRVIRDPCRKLAWDDRLIGAMRLAIQYGVEPYCLAIGAAAAVELLLDQQPTESIPSLLTRLWEAEGVATDERNSIIKRVEQALHQHPLSLSL